MPSLFSRSRTNSTPNKKSSLPTAEKSGALDEFGRISGRLTNFASTLNSPASSSKKDKKRAKDLEKRSRTLSNVRDHPELSHGAQTPLPTIPDGSFLPLNLERPRDDTANAEQAKEHDYGYLSYERHVVLGLEQVEQLVNVVSEELGTRGGITTPFIFSTTALDISSSAIRRLIRSFLNVYLPGNSGIRREETEKKWREEARFGGPHELGMCLRWGLARVVRTVGGQDVRGLISWDHYAEWRDSEAALNYPAAHFANFLSDLVPSLQSILITVLTLLSRLTANSTTSGHTPPTLSPLFGPLIFGLGPATLSFHHTYIHYLRAAYAMEHILLAFIRWQDSPRARTGTSGDINLSGSAAALGVPMRLKEWIKGYPAMLPSLQEQPKNQMPQPRRGTRVVRVMSVRRNVRMYSPDLVKSAGTWAHRSKPVGADNALALSKEWQRIVPPALKLPPRYSEAYKKRMNLPPNFHPDSFMNPPSLSAAPSASSYSSGTSASLRSEADYLGLGIGPREGDDRFRSLTDLKWGEFESMGFGGLGDEKKLEFDLTESARSERAAKRTTLSWNDFSSTGFTRTDGALSATLQFSTPLSKTISSWPSHSEEVSKKLKKTQKSLPPFGWDTDPVIGNEEVIEEAFVDVFCDLVYGGGWMDLERGEDLDRDCNWALIEYKSLPTSQSTVSGLTDPRTSTTLVLFEEFVPLEYRQQLAVKSSTRRRLPSFFSSPGKSKQWKQAATLNGRPYIVGHVPASPSYREIEFEGLLRGGSGTKIISLGSKTAPLSPTKQSFLRSPESKKKSDGPPAVPTSQPPAALDVPSGRSEEMHSDSTMSPSVVSKRSSRFRIPAVLPSPGGIRKAGLVPAEYSSVDFETRLASYSDDDFNNMEPESVKQKRRESKDDAWVDILVGTHARRMGGQDAELRDPDRKRGLRGRRSDPDMASMEVAQVLASVRNRTPSPESMVDRVDRDPGLDQFHDQDIDEIETVPRTSDVRSDDTAEYTTETDADNEGYDEEVDRPVIVPQRPKRMGYFDLHPERRAALGQQQGDDDPRALLADSEDSGDERDQANAQPTGALRKLPLPPERVRALPETPAPVPDEHEPSSAEHGSNGVTSKSKTAALIEMYRERERSHVPKPAGPVPMPGVVAPLQPSRLPVRSASLPKESPAPLPSGTANSTFDPPFEPPRIVLEEAGRASPARYVHGAPLHNVLEEDEEDA